MYREKVPLLKYVNIGESIFCLCKSDCATFIFKVTRQHIFYELWNNSVVASYILEGLAVWKCCHMSLIYCCSLMCTRAYTIWHFYWNKQLTNDWSKKKSLPFAEFCCWICALTQYLQGKLHHFTTYKASTDELHVSAAVNRELIDYCHDKNCTPNTLINNTAYLLQLWRQSLGMMCVYV